MADEKRLISYDVLIAHLDSCIEEGKGLFKSVCVAIKCFAEQMPTVDAVEVEKYKALVEMYHDLRENFIDYVCSGTCNVAPYCLNRCEGCVDRVGWCSQGSDECHGFNPAEVILDDAKMDGDGNG